MTTRDEAKEKVKGLAVELEEAVKGAEGHEADATKILDLITKHETLSAREKAFLLKELKNYTEAVRSPVAIEYAEKILLLLLKMFGQLLAPQWDQLLSELTGIRSALWSSQSNGIKTAFDWLSEEMASMKEFEERGTGEMLEVAKALLRYSFADPLAELNNPESRLVSDDLLWQLTDAEREIIGSEQMMETLLDWISESDLPEEGS